MASYIDINAPAGRHSGRLPALLLAAVLLLGLIAWQVLARSLPWQRPAAQTSAGTHVDPRLIIIPRTVTFSGILHGAPVTGTLYPAYPGRNLVRMTHASSQRGDMIQSQVLLDITMRGMAMRPIRAVLPLVGRGIAGHVALPMFGAYQARVYDEPGHRPAGAIQLVVPFPGQ